MGCNLCEGIGSGMKIGILEIMPKGHYTLVDSVVRIYASDPKNDIMIFTHPGAKEILSPLADEFSGRVGISVGEGDWYALFREINSRHLDRLYIITLDKYFKQIYKFEFNCPLYIVIHNIDLWFQAGLRYLLYSVLKSTSSVNELIYALKVFALYPYWRRKVRIKIVRTNGKFVVLSDILKKEVEKYADSRNTEVLPFSVYNPDILIGRMPNRSLRICIPGIISDIRRDYFSFFKILRDDLEKFRNSLEVELLGGIPRDEGSSEIIRQADQLKRQGLAVDYPGESFIPMKEYDKRLAKADLILGNMRVVLDKYSAYGKTKETGIVFCMIRAAVPGLLPAGYPVMEELKSSTVVYSDFDGLKKILESLISDRGKLDELRKNALRNSEMFEPRKIYNRLISVNQ
jgi:hypothetical protein